MPAPHASALATAACPNCGRPLAGLPPPVHHCPSCGQETHLHAPTLFEFVHEFVAHYVALEGALWRSLKTLLLRPGQLTLDYFEGRRRQHVLPLRLYLTASFLFFLVLKLSGGPSQQVRVHAVAPAATASAAASGPASAASASAATASTAADASSTGPAPSPDEAADDTEDSAPDGPDAVQIDPAERAIWQACVDQPGRCGTVETWIARGMLQATRKGTGVVPIFRQVLAWAPYAMFLMLPLFAGLLKTAYWRRGRAYGAHVVFSLHVHTYWYLAVMGAQLLPNPISGLLMLSLPWHATVAMRRVYGGGWPGTLGRAALVSVAYGVLLGAGSLGLMLLALLQA
jgi:Protein of unknown function (DUF3667)